MSTWKKRKLFDHNHIFSTEISGDSFISQKKWRKKKVNKTFDCEVKVLRFIAKKGPSNLNPLYKGGKEKNFFLFQKTSPF